MDKLDLYEKSFILVLSQRDIQHPSAGGAEVYVHNALKEIAKEIQIVHLSTYHPGQNKKEAIIDNIYYIRKGNNLFLVIYEAIKFYRKYQKNIILVIDHSNTHQFFTFLWARKKRVFFIHQLTLEIWGYFFGTFLGSIMKLVEEILISNSKGVTITVSNSTANDLKERGFQELYICPEGDFLKNKSLPTDVQKSDYFVYVGRIVPYKRIEDAIKVTHYLGKKLYIIGNGPEKYKIKLQKLIQELGSDTEMCGYLETKVKDELIQKAYMLIMPSIREGWGLVVTESANLGTPSIVYPVNGSIEAVNYGKAGFLTKEINWTSMLNKIKDITPDNYDVMQRNAFQYSLNFNWDNTALEFRKIIKDIIEKMGVNYEESSDRCITNHIQ